MRAAHVASAKPIIRALAYTSGTSGDTRVAESAGVVTVAASRVSPTVSTGTRVADAASERARAMRATLRRERDVHRALRTRLLGRCRHGRGLLALERVH